MHVVVQDIGYRPYMEDTCIASPKFIHNMDLYCVFDGHGGEYVSFYLKEKYEAILKEILRENVGTINDMLFLSVQKIAKQISHDQAQHCGSTLLIALRYGQTLYVANAGDCRAIVDFEGSVRQITQDHKPDTDTEKARIAKYGGFVSPASSEDVPRVNGQLAVSRSIGDIALYPHVTWVPDVYIVKLQPKKNTVLVLASDGIWDTMSNEDVMELFKNANDASTMKFAAQRCMNEAQRRGSRDNMTVLAVKL